ncbi:MAG: sugar ABC transporter permease, partial [Anaerolineae bacterium]|nr:sugar ABC transporter permease [Anaerolineae bacterium]
MIYHFGRGRARWIPYLLLIPGLFFYFLIALGPSLATSVYSFTDANGIANVPIHWIGLDNYKEFLLLGQAARDNYDALGRTLVFCIAVTVFQFALGLLVAMLLNQQLAGTNFFRIVFFLPVILGVVIQGLIWTLFLYPLGGPVDRVMGFLGTHSELLGSQPSEAFGWVIV